MFTESAKWIWTSERERENEYSEFIEKFSLFDFKKVICNIACDGAYSLYVNVKRAAFSACADYPYYKFFDEIDITELCVKDNEIKLVVCHWGKDNQTYINDKAGVIYAITADSQTVAASSNNTLSRVMDEYNKRAKL